MQRRTEEGLRSPRLPGNESRRALQCRVIAPWPMGDLLTPGNTRTPEQPSGVYLLRMETVRQHWTHWVSLVK